MIAWYSEKWFFNQLSFEQTIYCQILHTIWYYLWWESERENCFWAVLFLQMPALPGCCCGFASILFFSSLSCGFFQKVSPLEKQWFWCKQLYCLEQILGFILEGRFVYIYVASLLRVSLKYFCSHTVLIVSLLEA